MADMQTLGCAQAADKSKAITQTALYMNGDKKPLQRMMMVSQSKQVLKKKRKLHKTGIPLFFSVGLFSSLSFSIFVPQVHVVMN